MALDAVFRFSQRDFNELPNADQLEKRLADLQQHERALVTELKTAFASIGKSTVSYICLGETFLNKPDESWVLYYGDWVALRLVDFLDGPDRPKLSRNLNRLLWRFGRLHRVWMRLTASLLQP